MDALELNLLSPEERTEIARKAAIARWEKPETLEPEEARG